MGAIVRYCGHRATFVADIFRVGDANVVVANGPIEKCLSRKPKDFENATHHMEDFPSAGCWKPNRGFFVVPHDQVTELKPHA